MTDSEETGSAPARRPGRSRPARLLALVSGAAGRRAVVVALVVGTALNLINQGDAALAGHVNWAKLTLTYLVPFFVSLHGAAFAEPSRVRRPSDAREP